MQVRRLKIVRYRGISGLVWCPSAGVNCLIGPGDVGKSTVLDAIATALSPAPGTVASEHDYFEGNTSDGFVIEVLLGHLDDDVLRLWPAAPLWTWVAAEQKVHADPDAAGEGVLCIRAKGTADLEIEHVVVDPSEGEMPLSPSKRQKFGLSTMGSPVIAYRELRMSRGSLLSRNLDHEQLRSLVTEAVQATRENFRPSSDVVDRLEELSKALEDVAPGTGQLALALLSPRGQNLLGMVGLFARRAEFAVPLANAGLGTQQLALFTLSSLLMKGSSPLFVIDEIESGLEPFRQRDLVARIRKAIGTEGQAFITTHSPAVIGALTIEELKRLDPAMGDTRRMVSLTDGLERIRRRDPEALLCRLPVVAEGQTEVGLLELLLEHEAGRQGTTLGAIGIRLVDGDGQPSAFNVTAALRQADQRFGAFLDTEDRYHGKRDELAKDDDVAFGTYTNARCLEEALAKQLTVEELDCLIELPGSGGRDLSAARYQQLNEAAGAPGRKTVVELVADHGEERARQLFGEAANAGGWFKTRAEGNSVAKFLLERRPDCQIIQDAHEFWRVAFGLIADQMPIYRRSDAEPEA